MGRGRKGGSIPPPFHTSKRTVPFVINPRNRRGNFLGTARDVSTPQQTLPPDSLPAPSQKQRDFIRVYFFPLRLVLPQTGRPLKILFRSRCSPFCVVFVCFDFLFTRDDGVLKTRRNKIVAVFFYIPVRIILRNLIKPAQQWRNYGNPRVITAAISYSIWIIRDARGRIV